MSEQQQQTEQPPPIVVTRQAHTTHGSVGALVAVLALVTILGIIAGIIGRLCSGRQFMGHGQYDLEAWVEKKCSSCIDGNLAPPPSSMDSSHQVTMPEATPEEPSQADPSPPHNPPTD